MPIPYLEEIIKGSFNFVFNAYKAWTGFKVLAFGTTCVGKTTLWKSLETNKLVDPSTLNRTVDVIPLGEGGKFRLHDFKLSKVKVRIRALDMPGQEELREIWKQVLYKHKPHAIIFMMDNVKDTTLGVPSNGYEQERLDEHYRAFKYLRDLVLENDEVRDNLRAFLILVNKNDSFPENIRYGDIIDASKIHTLYARFQEISHVRMMARGCSALYGQNIQDSVGWMIKNL